MRNLCYMKGCFEALAHEFFYLVSFRFNVGRISIALVAAGLQGHCLLVSAILQMSLNFARKGEIVESIPMSFPPGANL